jgi:hypothetical protein
VWLYLQGPRLSDDEQRFFRRDWQTRGVCSRETGQTHSRRRMLDDLGKDRYGRTLGIVRLGKRNVNLELVQEGWAWWYRKYAPKNKELASAETAARKAKRGLWADAKPIPPWDWRQSERDKRLKSRSDVDTGYWLNTSSGVRHNRSCRNYRNTKRGRPCGADEGKACGMCGG